MSFLENFEVMLSTLVFIPLAISASLSYTMTVRNYGAVVYNPSWKKIISSITNEIFFVFIFGLYIVKYYNSKNWGKLVTTISYLIICFCVIIISRFFPKINNRLKEWAKINGKKPIDDPKRKKGKNSPDRLSSISGYISVVLSYFSLITFAMFILVTIILYIIANKFNKLGFENVLKIINYWNIIANVVTSVSISVNGHLIFKLLSEKNTIPNDSEINKIKERLND